MDNLDELLKIKELLDSGIITEKEFQELKKNLLTNPSNIIQEEKNITSGKNSEEIKSNKTKIFESIDTVIDNSEINKKYVEKLDKKKADFAKKNRNEKIIGYILFVFFLMVVIIGFYLYNYSDINFVTNSKANQLTKKSIDSIPLKTSSRHWKEERSEEFMIDSFVKFKVLILSSKGDESEKKFKLLLYKYNDIKGDDKYDLIYESSEVNGRNFSTLSIIPTTRQALIFARYDSGINGAFSVVTLDKKGKVFPENLDKLVEFSSSGVHMFFTLPKQIIEFNLVNDSITRKSYSNPHPYKIDSVTVKNSNKKSVLLNKEIPMPKQKSKENKEDEMELLNSI